MAERESSTDYLIQAYLGRADLALAAAQSNLENGFYDAAANRAYYAIFYAANALLLTKGVARKKHLGVLSAFRQHFVKTGLIEVEYSDIYGDVMSYRMKGDYVVTVQSDESDIKMVVPDARKFVVRIRTYIQG
jgi:uncharacterized protein (UPF0332 family)